MSKEQLEQISALVDDELEHGSRFVLNSLKNNESNKAVWGRYHLIGECMRGHLPAFVDMKLADRINRSLADEPLSQAAHRHPRLLKHMAGLAIAASVAVVTILGVRMIGSGPAAVDSTPAIAYNQAGNASDYQAVRVTAGTTPQQPAQTYKLPDDAQSRLNRYLVNYNEYRTHTGVQGTLPYVRIVAHEVEE